MTSAGLVPPPTWPPAIEPVWPTQWASLNYTGDFPYGPPPFDEVKLTGSWYYDWPTNKWRQDTCFTGMGPPSCKVELWDGNNPLAGSAGVGTTFTWHNGNCTYAPSMVPSITHPDSFASAKGGLHTNRSLVDGKWSDTWVSDTSSWLHYNFSTTMDVMTAKPVRDCGTTIPKPPWAYACSRHHHVKFGAEYDPAEWDAFFALDTSKCVPAMQSSLEQASRTRLPSVWPGALMRKVTQVTDEASQGAQTRQYCPMSMGSKCRYCSADGPSHCCSGQCVELGGRCTCNSRMR